MHKKPMSVVMNRPRMAIAIIAPRQGLKQGIRIVTVSKAYSKAVDDIFTPELDALINDYIAESQDG